MQKCNYRMQYVGELVFTLFFVFGIGANTERKKQQQHEEDIYSALEKYIIQKRVQTHKNR